MKFYKNLIDTVHQTLESEYEAQLDKSKIKLERPKNPGYGDLCTTAPLNFAKELKSAPMQIAEKLKSALEVQYADVFEVVLTPPGFVNLRLSAGLYADIIQSLNNAELINLMEDSKEILLEYVSANPTGDLHLGHGRGAVIGSALITVLQAVGHQVASEFYLNDAGEQITKLKRSAWAALHDRYDEDADQYPPELIKPYLDGLSKDLNEDELGIEVKKRIIVKQKSVLSGLRVPFDKWVSEKEEIHQTGALQNALDLLKEKDLVYEKDGATWLKSESLGDERDRVLIKSDGRATYLMGDFAYHLHKFSRSEHLLNIWGADHAGQDNSLKLGLEALGADPEKLKILFLQLVSLQRDGKDVRMSKRTGTLITIEEVLDEVGPDAFRATMLTSNVNNRLIFDVELVKQASEQNPVFYLQYSHARACSIGRRALENEIQVDIADSWQQAFSVDLPEPELKATKELALKLSFFNNEIHTAARNYNPCHILNYLLELAALFHGFYNVPCKVVDGDNLELSQARLALVQAFQTVMKRGLEILSITAPESM